MSTFLNSPTNRKCVVVLSGGADSTICLFWAGQHFHEVHAVTFDYGQRHRIEIESAVKVAKMAGVTSHEIINLGAGILRGTSPLVSDALLDQYDGPDALPGGLEKTFVPMRNQLFLTVAANRAYVLVSESIVTGVCQEDSGGYPDCRQDFIDSFDQTCNLGTFTGEDLHGPAFLNIFTPLMTLTKAASVELAMTLPGCMDALAWTHTAYDGAYPPTGHDHATLLRAKGFIEANVPDPLIVRAWREGLMDLPDTSNYDDMREKL
jgi:7-cyano-7-deazaguanine synthase